MAVKLDMDSSFGRYICRALELIFKAESQHYRASPDVLKIFTSAHLNVYFSVIGYIGFAKPKVELGEEQIIGLYERS